MPANIPELEKRLWSAADELRANSELKSSEYSVPVSGLIYLRYASYKFSLAEAGLAAKATSGRRTIGPAVFPPSSTSAQKPTPAEPELIQSGGNAEIVPGTPMTLQRFQGVAGQGELK